MTTKTMPAGLPLRLAAIEKIQSVLDGDMFTPITAGEMPDARDRAQANRLATTVLRRNGHLDHILGEMLHKGMPKRSGSFSAALRLGLTELLFMPERAEHSAVYLAVEAVKRDKRAAHLAKLMNGVLRQVQRNPDQFADLPLAQLFPKFVRDCWIRQYGAEAVDRFAQALLDGAPLDLTLRDAARDVMDKLDAAPLHADSVRVLERDVAVADLPGYAEGRWWVQDLASAVPARFMDLQPKARVLDMCAAPGGKTAQLVKAGFDVTALDVEATRLDRVAENLKRLGFGAHYVVQDGVAFAPEEPFDGILVDAPCTASGTFRRHPEVIMRLNKARIDSRIGVQRKLLTSAAQNTKEGGVLIYCTCSLEPEEGEEQARWLAKSMPEMENFPISADEAGALRAGLSAEGWLRLHPAMLAPGNIDGAMDGFFVARFHRRRVQE